MALLDPNLHLTPGTFFKYLILAPFNLLYNILTRLWLLSYRIGFKKAYKSNRKVISVGNITVGGTGKTPLIDWLLERSAKKGIKTAVLTRGYKSKDTSTVRILNQSTVKAGTPVEYGDEPWFLFSKHPQISVFVSPDRVRAAKLAEKQADLLLLDDGMQHLKIQRDLDLSLIDASTGLGNQHLLPLGPVREPLSGLRRSDAILFTKTNHPSANETIRKLRQIKHLDQKKIFRSQYVVSHFFSSRIKKTKPAKFVTGKQCMLISGIGNPGAFEKTIISAGGVLAGHLTLDDHQAYDNSTLERINRFAKTKSYDFLICTEKDWVKLKENEDKIPEIQVVVMRLEPDGGFVRFIDNWLSENLANSQGSQDNNP